jgi:hypothetical protein
MNAFVLNNINNNLKQIKMKTVKKIFLVSLIIGGLFMSIQFTHGNISLTDLTVFALGDKVSAGPDAILCDDLNFTTQGSTNSIGIIVWTTVGDGVFNNPYSRNAIYTPGVQDLISGHITLTISIIPFRNYTGRMISDSMILSLVVCDE